MRGGVAADSAAGTVGTDVYPFGSAAFEFNEQVHHVCGSTPNRLVSTGLEQTTKLDARPRRTADTSSGMSSRHRDPSQDQTFTPVTKIVEPTQHP